MAEKVLMLALSPTMETGIISRWLKQEGDPVSSGDVICEVETDKATMDYESPADGVLLKIVLPAGASTSIGDLIAIIGKPGEDFSDLLADPGDKPVGSAEAAPDLPGSAMPAPAVAADGQDTVHDNPSGFIRSSPLARKIAQQNDLPLESIKGSGPAGRIVKSDVEKTLDLPAAQPDAAQPAVAQPATARPAAAQPAAARPDAAQPAAAQPAAARPAVQAAAADNRPAAAGSAAMSAPVPQDVVVPISGKRRIIAQRVSESMFSAPHYYLKVPVQMDGIMASRSLLNARPETKVSINAFLIKFTAEALKKHPVVNATWTGDTIIQHGRIDIGLAVAQKDGLITPVVRDCGSKGIVQIENELKDLIQKARGNALKPEEYTGATFTISNLGSYGIEEFTAIINPPGSAILAVGEIRREAVVQKDDAIAIKSIMKMTLSCDHRVIDGATGAVFLTELRDMLEEPVRILY